MRNLSKNLGLSAIAVFLSCLSSFTPTALAKYSGGTGEPNDPYRIATAEDLNDIGNHQEDWNKYFVLVNDVNLAQYTGTQFKIIGNYTTRFTGIFDGNDHKISNFKWFSMGGTYIGLFGCVGKGSQIKNMGMEDVDVNAVNEDSVGGLVGFNSGTMTNCYSTGSVSGDRWVGGLVGVNVGGIANCHSLASVLGKGGVGGPVAWNEWGTITNCCSVGSVSGDSTVGGVVGLNSGGMITTCFSSGSVSGNDGVGGLVGDNRYSGTITGCYSTGSVSGKNCVGGLGGSNMGDKIADCYCTGSVSGTGYDVGGLVGYNRFSMITNCYSSGSVSGNYGPGGLIGHHEMAEVRGSYWDIQTSGQSWSAGGEPKTTAEMKIMSTFTVAGWDFVEIWGIGENQTYPYLLTGPAGDFNYDKNVDLLDLAILASHWLARQPF